MFSKKVYGSILLLCRTPQASLDDVACRFGMSGHHAVDDRAVSVGRNPGGRIPAERYFRSQSVQ
jgi:hypothetical protein